MYFRFGFVIVVLTAVTIFGIELEKRNLVTKRAISEQYEMLDAEKEHRARLMLQTQQLGAPPRLLDEWKTQTARQPETPAPLLEWRISPR